jgi:Rrf2 family protein
LIELAQRRSGEPVACASLAVNKQLPCRYLLQILRRLVSAGVLRSARGSGGGYALKRPAREITLLDIIDAVEGSSHVSAEFTSQFDAKTCELLLATIRQSDEAGREALSRLTLAELSQVEAHCYRTCTTAR